MCVLAADRRPLLLPLPRRAPRRAAAAAMSGSDELQSFLALAKGARGRAAAAVVADATAAPGLFAFGELLDTPGVKEAREARARRRHAGK